MRLFKRYATGFQDGVVFASERYERELAVLREELVDQRRAAREALEAERTAADRVIALYGGAAISPAGGARALPPSRQ
jgi:hypothetical protein